MIIVLPNLTSASSIHSRPTTEVYVSTTATPIITPVFSSSTIPERTQTHSLTGLTSSEQGYLSGRRPAHGLKFPRGYYNK